MIYILIPTFNEKDNIPILKKNFSNLNFSSDFFFVFVDDASSDNTIDVIRKNFDVNTKIITKSENLGPGDSFNIGFEWILDNTKDEDLVVTMEADNTSDIRLLEKMIQIHKLGYDLVLASPYAQGGGFKYTSIFRKIISFSANMLFRLFFNIKVLTLSSFYRVYSIQILKKIKNDYGVIVKEKGFICMLEILLKSIKLNAKIIEVPMILNSNNREGKSKMKVFKTSISYLKFLFKSK